ncbi:class I SAM-dependent DNA methyltransferase [Streptacidiphilus monticola]|jgi:SAM-dependent methyltransferase|uniref:Class I SAM-dependent DNA methyltransferase n=1 Tax=Streptacidiphilus monticola TaxID=2161674 RepID=A0ABW1G081_9ACTN
MTEPEFLQATRESYDTVAESYAERVPGLFASLVLGRALLAAFAEEVRGDGGGPVAEVGCGPGHVTEYLAGLGLDVSGVDLSPGMVAVARRRYPALRFDVGSMTGLDYGEGELAGVVSWWSIVHTPPEAVPVVFAEFRRVLRPGGRLAIGFHVGEGERRPEQAYGHPVSYRSFRFGVEEMAGRLGHAGFDLTAEVRMPPPEPGRPPQAVLLARVAG